MHEAEDPWRDFCLTLVHLPASSPMSVGHEPGFKTCAACWPSFSRSWPGWQTHSVRLPVRRYLHFEHYL
ncbi:hypothetical protein C8R44DRAFT_772477 [Mycena epipterygia]|nr:hypothetical protein C8R44DRAFT_772477 [Mycena epipterygia]